MKLENLRKDQEDRENEDNASYESTIIEVNTRNDKITVLDSKEQHIVYIKVKVSE